MKTTKAYRFDNNFYFDSVCVIQSDPKSDKWLIPSDCLIAEPDFKEGFFYKADIKKSKWIAEKIPSNCDECLEIKIKHTDNNLHSNFLRNLFKKLTDENQEYELKYDDNLTLSVVKKEIKPKTIDELKAEKLSELKALCHNFDDRLVNNDMYVISSLGFKINADLRSQNNIKGLIAINADTVNFVDYNNEIHKLKASDLNTLLVECSKNGENLYMQKWAYAEQIKACKTIAELEKISFDFKMLDFSEVVDEVSA